jgi:hypothetical protein
VAHGFKSALSGSRFYSSPRLCRGKSDSSSWESQASETFLGITENTASQCHIYVKSFFLTSTSFFLTLNLKRPIGKLISALTKLIMFFAPLLFSDMLFWSSWARLGHALTDLACCLYFVVDIRQHRSSCSCQASFAL